MPYADIEVRKKFNAMYQRDYQKLDKFKNYRNKYNRENKENVLLIGARGRAKRRGLEFSITIDDILIPERCPVIGVILDRILLNEGRKRTPNPCAPSLDRIDPSKGYIKGNVRVISWRANNLKSNGTLDEFIAIVADLKKLNER